MSDSDVAAWMLECPTPGGDTGWVLSWSRSGSGVCNRLQGTEHEKPLYTHPMEWLPVETAPQDVWVLVIDCGFVEIAALHPTGGWFDRNGDECFSVSGWMPLPKVRG